MTKNFLITRPKHDVITSYLHDFTKEIIKTLRSTKDIHVTNLAGNKATRNNLEKCLLNESPGLVHLNGHGDRKSVAGHKDEIILDKNNISITRNKIIYALSCDSLEDLGQLAVEKGAKTYIGYKARFMMVIDPTRVTNPNNDNNALPFKRACSAMMTSLVFGNTVGDAIERTKEEYRHSIRSYGTSEDDPYGDAPLIRFALAWNLEFLDMCGDPGACF